MQPRAGLAAVGVHRELRSSRALLDRGEWVDGADGARIWRFAVSSDRAAAIRIHFTGFAVGAGAVWVYAAADHEPRAESFTGAGPHGDGDFWCPTIFGEEAVVEYRPDPTSAHTDLPPFEVEEIAHLWESPEQLSTPLRSRSSAAQSPGEFLQGVSAVGSESAASPRASLIGAEAAACQVDISCHPDWNQTSQAVALILFESGGGSYSCSGTLLNTRNQSFTPYFLTAAHCITSNADARTVEAFWDFRSSTCNGVAPVVSELQSTLGAQQVVRYGDFEDARGDFNLLLLSEEPPDGVVFSGWDPSETAFGTPVVGIHHPAGEQQRITFGTAVRDDRYGASDAYLIVQEDIGRTEGGSSGSGLFAANNVLVGALSFGPALRRNQTVCDLNPSYSGYSRFSELYPRISRYLEDQIPPPDDPADTSVSGTAQNFSLNAVRTPTLFEEPSLKISAPSNAVSLTIELQDVNPASADLDLYVRKGAPPATSGGSVIADFSSTGVASAERIVIDATSSPPLQAGDYYVRVALFTRFTAVTGRVVANIETRQDVSSEHAPVIAAVLHAADQTASAVAPGQLVSIYGSNLGAETGLQPALDANGRIPVAVNGVTVHFNGVAAPILFSRADQINVQVPYEVAGASTATVTVARNGLVSASFMTGVTATTPQVFRYFDGTNRGVVFNQDGSLNSAEAPAARGEMVVFYVTGQGAVTPAMQTGALAHSSSAVPAGKVSVRIGGADAEVVFAGIPVGLAGVMQVNARVPANSVAGPDAMVTVRVGDSESRAARLAIR